MTFSPLWTAAVARLSRFEASRVLADDVRIIGEVQLLRGALGDALCSKQADLGRDEIEGVGRLHVLLRATARR